MDRLLLHDNIYISIIGFILILGALVGAIGVIINRVFKPTFRWINKTVKSIDKIDYIYGELRENGGHSIKDSIRRIEQRLVFNDERQRAIMRDYKYGIMEMDASGLVVWANRTFMLKTGHSLSEIRGNGWIGLIEEIDRVRITEEWEAAKDQKRETNVKFHLTTSNSDKLPVHLIIHVMRDAHSNNVGFLGVIDFEETH